VFCLTASRIHIIHVGNMNNKGTQALLKSDVNLIKEILGNVYISVSTNDVEGVRKLNLPLDDVLPTIIDIPYEVADRQAKRFRYSRDESKYRVYALASFLYMFIQAVFSVISVVSVKAGSRALYRTELVNHIKECDLVVSCSDENFKESASLLPLNIYWVLAWWSVLFERTWEILVAKSLGKPVVMLPNSVGPFRTWIGRFLSRLSLNNCDCLLVREPTSYGIVKSLRIRSPKILTFDTALLFKTEGGLSSTDFSSPVIAVSPGIYSHALSENEVHDYVKAHAKALDKAIEEHELLVVFLPHFISGFQYDDLDMSRLILREMRNSSKAKILVTDTVEELKSKIDQMDMVISSKMHPAVLAISGYVPTLCIAYDHKQTAFFMELGLGKCVIRLRELSYGILVSKIDYVWNNRDEIGTQLAERIPKLQKHTRESIKQALTGAVLRKDNSTFRGDRN